ncbi:protein TIC 62, chloroplastic-like [Coffea eugenioides]|uniref:protein TIC 62, chloroplastic-like n=1 Tax=Coffea eugenioides TaxID=49369 RepID=UPI000F60D4F0|nr:protein TIC 62, chloroplastic-like [Coffea eugenioides]
MQLLRPPQSVTLTNDVALPCGLSTKRPLFLRGQVAKLGSSNIVRCPDGHGQTLKPIHVRIRPHASVAVKVSVKTAESAPSDVVLKDGNLIFVAGATGRVGSRTVRELLKSGSRVRAGVRSAQRAESLVQSVQQMKFDAAETGLTPPIERLEIVECDLEKKDQIGPALGNASIVICCIGASEKEIFDITGPYRIDYQATKNLIDAATIAQVDHFILLTSLGTNKVGFPAAILNLFWGVLIWKRKAEEALLASGLPYTIVRPGGMERPTDAFKETHNITVSQEDTLFGGLVSNLQVAELMAFMAKNRSLSYCKVVEVIAETTAPLTPMGELLAKIPSQRAEVFSPGKLDDAVGPGTAATEIATSGTPSTTVEKETVQPKAAEMTPLSPYTAYEDLKPPSSPSPSPSGPKEVHASNDILSELTGGNDVGTINIGEENYPQKLASRHSPYLVYPDLKPPSSPSPNAPVSSTSNEMLPSIADKLGN